MVSGEKVGQNGTAAAKFAPKVVKTSAKQLPGRFAGWIDEKQRIAWTVSPYQKDKRTGALETRSMGPYAEELLAVAVPWVKERGER